MNRTTHGLAQSEKEEEDKNSLMDKLIRFFSCSHSNRTKSRTPSQKSNEAMKRKSTCFFLGLALLILTFILSFAGVSIMWFTELYLDSIQSAMILREGTQVFKSWSEPPVKPLICGYVFNYTNMEDYRAKKDAKIRIQEVGPYCYRETQKKVDIKFSEDGQKITYSDWRTHEFEPTKSKGKKDDVLIVPNMALISTAALSQNLGFINQLWLASFLKRWLNYTDSMVTVHAHDYFFGYDDKLLQFVAEAAKYIGQEIPMDKFGLFLKRAIMSEDTITVHTGVGNLNKMGVVTEVNGESSLNAWPEEECNRIDGSDGAFFPRNGINDTATLYLFHKDLCRKMPFVFDKEIEFQDGVMGMRFHPTPDVYDTNGTCYCPKTGCAPKGVFNLSPCSEGVPIMMSFPHFLNSDPAIREPFEGLHPDPSKHDFYLHIQRLLGFTLGTVSRLQLNIQVKKPRGFFLLKDLPQDIILPIVWIQVAAEKLPPDVFNYIYHSSITVRQIQVVLQWVTLTCALFSLIIIIIVIVFWRKKSKVPVADRGQVTQEMLPITPKAVIY